MIFNNIDAAQTEANKPKRNVDKIRPKQKSIDDDVHDNIEEIVVAGDKMIPADSKRKSIASVSNKRKDSLGFSVLVITRRTSRTLLSFFLFPLCLSVRHWMSADKNQHRSFQSQITHLSI